MSNRGPNTYPLEALRSLRRDEVEARARALAEAQRAHHEAQRAREAAEAALEAHRAETRRISDEELARDRQGRTVAETLRAQAYLARRRDEERAAVARADAARAHESKTAAALEAARAALAEARAEKEAIERHRTAWAEARRKQAEAREEEEADDRAARRDP